MDDKSRTQKTLEQLADLFLTDASGPSSLSHAPLDHDAMAKPATPQSGNTDQASTPSAGSQTPQSETPTASQESTSTQPQSTAPDISIQKPNEVAPSPDSSSDGSPTIRASKLLERPNERPNERLDEQPDDRDRSHPISDTRPVRLRPETPKPNRLPRAGTESHHSKTNSIKASGNGRIETNRPSAAGRGGEPTRIGKILNPHSTPHLSLDHRDAHDHDDNHESSHDQGQAMKPSLDDQPDETIAPKKPRLVGDRSMWVEVVFTGNLPGFGGPWLTQYAQHVATQHGATGLLRMDQGQIDIELALPNDQKHKQSLLAKAPWAGPGRSLEQALRGLAEWEPCPVRDWLIHLPTPATQQSLPIAGQLANWTVLCGADDAAVVAGYRLVKQMIDQTLAGDPVASNRRIGVMIVGSDEITSRAAANKLIETAGRFLTTPVEMIGWQKRMMPGFTHPVGSYSIDRYDPWPTIYRALAPTTVMTQSPSIPSKTKRRTNGATSTMNVDTRRPAASYLEVDAEKKLQAWNGHGTLSPADFWADKPYDPTEGFDPQDTNDPLPFPTQPATTPRQVQADRAAYPSNPTQPVSPALGPRSDPLATVGGGWDWPHRANDNPNGRRTGWASTAAREASMATSGVSGVSGGSGGECGAVVVTPAPGTFSGIAGPRASGTSGASGGRTSGAQSPWPTSASPDLSTFMAGMVTPFRARCPRHPHTQLTVDAQGRLHLLRHVTDPNEPFPTPGHPGYPGSNSGSGSDPAAPGTTSVALETLRDAVIDLIGTRSWVREHLSLLQMIDSQPPIDPYLEPVLHLFTPQAKLGVSLVHKLDGFVVIHLLQEIQVDSQSAWHCIELN